MTKPAADVLPTLTGAVPMFAEATMNDVLLALIGAVVFAMQIYNTYLQRSGQKAASEKAEEVKDTLVARTLQQEAKQDKVVALVKETHELVKNNALGTIPGNDKQS